MKQYLDLCQKILDKGVRKPNRTGVDTIGIQGEMMKFDMADGFPAVTTKELNFKSVVAELLGFIRGYDNAADFRKLGCNIWDANANENQQWVHNINRKGEDDLGRIYGVQGRGWRQFKFVRVAQKGSAYHRGNIDQLKNVVDDLSKGIDNRREIVTHWNPSELNQMALPPCHLLYQFGIEDGKLNLALYQRSCDFPLGIPFNIASYSLLLHMISQITGLKPGVFTHFMFDCHIYVNQIPGIEIQLNRETYILPELLMADTIKSLKDIETWVLPSNFWLAQYDHHDHISFPFSV